MNEIKAFLNKLGFIEDNNIFEKNYNDYSIKVDIKKGKIYYRDDEKTTIERIKDGKIQLGDTTSSHFKPKGGANQEAFVVLFAVDRLLSIGYNPNDLHLERKWKLGIGAKSGKADINIYKDDKTYIIIECKRYDKYEKEKKRMLNNGGQLFSYLNQDTNAKYLALFTSKFEEDEIFYENSIVKIIDNPKKVEECKKKKKELCSYSEAHNKEEFFYIWKNLYGCYFYKYGIFEEDAIPYNVELKPLKKKDLIPFTTSKGLFNKFAEILRHNNISDNANAFNKMLSLILCKIVDEEKQDDEILDFQVIEGISDEKLVDKLQKLYKIGVSKYLGIDDFVYHSDEEIEERIKLFPQRKPLKEILEFFKEIKYYTDKTFAFKEIYNKKLFEENALILKEVVEMLQHYKFKNSTKNQFLGDFFELLLNHGVKQSEGQFFTPLPIVRFIILSLNLKSLQEEKEAYNKILKRDSNLIKTLDFACGAGHFLIEAIDEIEKINKEKFNFDINEWTKKYIFGIEKDYRLARTAKIACFLNGDGEANIIYGDGLKKHEALKEDIEKFDLIVTNPPYSVKEFKNYVELNKDEFELFDYLSEKASEIEVLFIERAKQALREGGRIGIILPSSILTNSGIYTKARELILKYFDIIAITELGNKTFIATGTNTVILFMRRKKDWYAIDYKKIADEIFDYFKFSKVDYIDTKNIFREFIKFREIPHLDKFIELGEMSEEFKNNEKIKEYLKDFENSSEIKELKKKKNFKNLSKEEQQKILERKFIEYVIKKEKEKFYYFALTYNQKVVVIKSPSETKAQKEFLGYEFNKKRGFEGIEIYTDSNGKPTTKLYDEEDNPQKANYYIKNAFDGVYKDIEVDFVKYLDLIDMLDFDSVKFEKIINTNVNEKLKIKSDKWEMVKLGDVASLIRGVNYQKEDQVSKSNNKILTADNITLNNELEIKKIIYIKDEIKIPFEKKLQKNDIFICLSSGSLKHLGKIAFIKKDLDFYSGGFMGILRANDKIIPKLLFEILKKEEYKKYFEYLAIGSNINNLSSIITEIKIPLPPLEVQQKIVEELEKRENESEKLKKENKKLKEKIKEIIYQMENGKWKMENLGDIYNLITGKRPKGGATNSGIFSIGGEHLQNGKIVFSNPKYVPIDFAKKLEEKGAKVKKYDVLMCKDGALSGKVALAREDLEAVINEHVFIIRNENKILNLFLYYLLSTDKWQTKLKNIITGSAQGGINSTNLKNFKIPLPPLEIQKEIVKKIESIEELIKQNEERINNLNQEKEKILKREIF